MKDKMSEKILKTETVGKLILDASILGALFLNEEGAEEIHN